MKKIFLLITLAICILACKKESSNPTNNSTTNSNSTNPVTCIDNPNINFTCIGTPIGKFSDCIKDMDGNTYKTVTIGTQTWMAENLKTSKYNDGTIIQNITKNSQWTNNTTGAWAYYNNDTSNNLKHGKLYNWYAISKTTNGNKNICPTGWHVPSDSEWTSLTNYLGGENIAGGKMKEIGSTIWRTPNTYASNTSLLTAIPSGLRDNDGTYDTIGYLGCWWSSTESKNDAAWLYFLNNTNGIVSRYYDGDKEAGASLRCIKD